MSTLRELANQLYYFDIEIEYLKNQMNGMGFDELGSGSDSARVMAAKISRLNTERDAFEAQYTDITPTKENP